MAFNEISRSDSVHHWDISDFCSENRAKNDGKEAGLSIEHSLNIVQFISSSLQYLVVDIGESERVFLYMI